MAGGFRRMMFDILGDAVDEVSDAIDAWNYELLSSEAEAEESLHAHLNSVFPYLEIRRQFPYDRIRADLLIDDLVAIELKYQLKDTKEFQRLIGQLDTYAAWGKRMIVLIVGDTQDDFEARVRNRLRNDWGDEDEARLIKVPLKRPAT